MAANVYQIITDRIIEEMSKGIIPWQRPWHGAIDGAIKYKKAGVLPEYPIRKW